MKLEQVTHQPIERIIATFEFGPLEYEIVNINEGATNTIEFKRTKASDPEMKVFAKKNHVTFNPELAIQAYEYAADAIEVYNRVSRRFVTRFMAKDPRDRQLYQHIVDDLLKTGHYQLVRSHWVGEGGIKVWELRLKSPKKHRR